MVEGSLPVALDGSAPEHLARRALSDAKRHLQKSALKLAGYLVAAYVVLKLIPTLKQALRSLEHVSWEWGGVGVGALILHRFGVPSKVIAEREFNLSFLNTAVDALALIVFGVGLATGILSGESRLLLTLLPAAVAATGIAAALLIARRAGNHAERLHAKHPKIASALTTLANAVDDTKRLLVHRGSWTSVLGVLAYLGFDVLVLWTAFLAVHVHPVPGFAIVIMGYIIGALGGSIPLPASIGTIGGITGMLILYGVAHNAAIAAVLLHQAIGLLVPLTGGGIAYAILRRRVGPIVGATDSSDPAHSDQPARW
jgi:uncharacterized membrane protein YbhN (UPF0104 family)